MENENQPQGSSAANLRPNTPNPQPDNRKFGGGMRVIQPLSTNPQSASTAQSPETTPVATNQSQMTSGPVAPNEPVTPTTLAKPRPNPSAIYPDATRNPTDIPMPSSLSDNDETLAISSEDTRKTKGITMIVMAFGAFIVVTCAINVLTWLRLAHASTGVSSVGILGLILAGGELCIGLGIIMRREVARAIYVVLAAISLVFSLYGTYNYFTAAHSLAQTEQAALASTQHTIASYQDNPTLTATQKARIIQPLQEAAKRDQQLLDQNKNALLPLIIAYIIAIAPLVFLTRPSVKAVFE